jgi:hypothetical protein
MFPPTRWFGVTFDDTERNLAAEQTNIAEIVDKVLAMQAAAAAKQKRPPVRGTHAKGICARGTFEVFDVTAGRDRGQATRLGKGIFGKPGIYPAIVRFANSDPNVNSDAKADVRSLSFSVEFASGGTAAGGAGDARQDYSLQSAATVPFNDIQAFLGLMAVLTASNPAAAAWSLPWKDKLRLARTMALALSQLRQPIEPYQQLRYWSTVPFRHGPTDVVKYCATPCAHNPARPLRKDSPSFLQDELARHLDEDTTMSCFDFGLQFLDSENMTYWGKRRDAGFWIENASVKWSETQTPFHTVARLSLLPKSPLAPDASEAVYFDVTGHATADSAPLGGVNRARWAAEVASRKARLGT